MRIVLCALAFVLAGCGSSRKPDDYTDALWQERQSGEYRKVAGTLERVDPHWSCESTLWIEGDEFPTWVDQAAVVTIDGKRATWKQVDFLLHKHRLCVDLVMSPTRYRAAIRAEVYDMGPKEKP